VLEEMRCFASDPQGVVHVDVVVVVDVVADDVEVTATTGAVPSASVTKSVGSSRLLGEWILMASLLMEHLYDAGRAS